jgi:hypothetical protein
MSTSTPGKRWQTLRPRHGRWVRPTNKFISESSCSLPLGLQQPDQLPSKWAPGPADTLDGSFNLQPCSA